MGKVAWAISHIALIKLLQLIDTCKLLGWASLAKVGVRF